MSDLISNCIQGAVGLATVTVTVLLWRVAKRQADIYQRQADLMKGALKASETAAQASVISAQAATAAVEQARLSTQKQLRAYIGLKEAKIKDVAAGKKPTLLLEFTNAGQTPAQKVLLWSNFKFDGDPETIVRKPTTPSSSSTVFPNGVISRQMPMERALTVSEVAAIKAGAAAIYVYGELTYEDAFGQSRRTHFNMVHRKGCAAFELLVCKAGNEAD